MRGRPSLGRRARRWHAPGCPAPRRRAQVRARARPSCQSGCRPPATRTATRWCRPPGGRSTPATRTTSSATARPPAAPRAAVVAAVAAGGIITFDCGPAPSDHHDGGHGQGPQRQRAGVVLDGGGKVTLSGGGERRILYMNTCDQAQGWHHLALPGPGAPAADRAEPHLRRRQLHRADLRRRRRAAAPSSCAAAGSRSSTRGSSATAATATGPDLGGAAIRVLSQYHGPAGLRRHSTFGGAGQGGICSNGGALSSIGVSWVVLNSVHHLQHGDRPRRQPGPGRHPRRRQRRRDLQRRQPVHRCASPARSSQDNHANEGGGAIFFVSNDRTGTMAHRGLRAPRTPATASRRAGFRHLLPRPGPPGGDLLHPRLRAEG